MKKIKEILREEEIKTLLLAKESGVLRNFTKKMFNSKSLRSDVRAFRDMFGDEETFSKHIEENI